jgi:hypothetical protein
MQKELIQQIALFMKEASDSVSRLEAENTQLKEKVASQEAELGQHKEAGESSVTTAVLSVDDAGNLASNLIQAGFLKEASRNAATVALSSDPKAAASFLEKLAASSIENKGVPSLGEMVKEKEASAQTPTGEERESDKAFDRYFG